VEKADLRKGAKLLSRDRPGNPWETWWVNGKRVEALWKKSRSFVGIKTLKGKNPGTLGPEIMVQRFREE
jgi:hypothetical protein